MTCKTSSRDVAKSRFSELHLSLVTLTVSSCPAIELAFALYGCFQRGVLFLIDQLDREVCGHEGGAVAGLVGLQPLVDVLRLADVEGVVGAAEDVDVVHRRRPRVVA